jgi:hypothetical protein
MEVIIILMSEVDCGRLFGKAPTAPQRAGHRIDPNNPLPRLPQEREDPRPEVPTEVDRG